MSCVPVPGAGALAAFCKHVIAKQASNWPPSEETLAQEFVDYFKLEAVVPLCEIQELCEKSGIVFRVAHLPKTLHGFNHRFRDKREILISESHVLTREHTALHELREMLEYDFCDLKKPICMESDKEERADQFAFSVRMCALSREVPKVLELIGTIESTWRRRAMYVLTFVMGVAYLLSLALIPHLEELAEKNET